MSQPRDRDAAHEDGTPSADHPVRRAPTELLKRLEHASAPDMSDRVGTDTRD